MDNANRVSDRRSGARAWLGLLAIGLVLAGGLGGCDGETRGTVKSGADHDAAAAPKKTVADWFPIKVGDVTVQMQLAVEMPEMQRGLMERRELPEDGGMLFVYDAPRGLSFWMHNTPLPLDIGFFDPMGHLREVYAMHPFDETSVSSRGTRLQYALEMRQGWFAENGLKPGKARLDLPALAAALQARGYDPARFGLPYGN